MQHPAKRPQLIFGRRRRTQNQGIDSGPRRTRQESGQGETNTQKITEKGIQQRKQSEQRQQIEESASTATATTFDQQP